MSAPRWACALLRRLAPPDRGEAVLGDLEEGHRERVQRRGRTVASLMTSLEALDMAFALIRGRRRRERLRGDRSSAGRDGQATGGGVGGLRQRTDR